MICSSAFCADLSNFINTNNSYINIRLSGTNNSTTNYIRTCGYNNASYDSSYKPRFLITWTYDKSSGVLDDSNYFYNLSPTLTIFSNTSTDYHKVEWYINNETVPYYSQTLSSGITKASCSYFGTSPSGPYLNSSNYFSEMETIPAKVVLFTYSADDTLLGLNTYTFSLTKPTGGSIGTLSSSEYEHNSNVTLTIYPQSSSYSHKTFWYINNTKVFENNI